MKKGHIILLGVIAFLIYKIFSSKMEKFYDWLIKWEGKRGVYGRSKTDNASSDPAPGTNGIHTHMGITWATFRDNAVRLGYPPSVDLFLKMPSNIWGKITFERFWKVWDNIDQLQSIKPGIAYFIADFGFNSGTNGAFLKLCKYQRQYMGIKDSDISRKELIRNFILDPTPQKERLKHLAEFRINYLKTLDDWRTYGKGWTNRINSLIKTFG